MGTWGPGVFENDDAYDLLEAVMHGSTTEIEEIMKVYPERVIEDELDAHEATHALAACYFVAAARGAWAPVSDEAKPKIDEALGSRIMFSGRTVAQRLASEIDPAVSAVLAEASVAAIRRSGLEDFECSEAHLAETVDAGQTVVTALRSVTGG